MTGPVVLDEMEERERQQAAVVSGRQEKKLQEFRSLKGKVDALRALKKSPEEMSVSQLKLMVTWYKHAGDLPIPTTKMALLERLHATIGRQDPREPAIPSLQTHPLPVPVAEAIANDHLD